MGWGEPSAYPAGSAHGRILTPNLDAFAASGIRFTDAYAGYTVCAPSRTTLMTGFHSGHFGAKKLPGTSLPTSVDVLTTPEMLQKAGYATAGIGKMAPLNAPVLQGFDYFIGQISQSYCHNMYPRAVDTGNTTGLNVNLTQNYKIPPDPTAARKLCMANPSEFNYTVDITHEHSMTWIKNEGGKMREGEKENHNRVECSHFPALFFLCFYLKRNTRSPKCLKRNTRSPRLPNLNESGYGFVSQPPSRSSFMRLSRCRTLEAGGTPTQRQSPGRRCHPMASMPSSRPGRTSRRTTRQ